MQVLGEILSAIVASMWPQKYRRWRYPDKPPILVLGTFLSGTLEWIIFGWLEYGQFQRHFLAQADHFSQGNSGTQVAALAVIVIAEVFYPLSLLLIVMTGEGFIRFVSGAILREPLPSLPVSIGVRVYDRLTGRAKAVPQL